MPSRAFIPHGEIYIRDIRKTVEGSVQRVSAEVDGEVVWFESADAELSVGAETFLGAFLIVAFELERSLVCDEPVCPVWYKNIEHIGQTYAEHWKRKCVSPVVPKYKSNNSESVDPNLGSGVFFTCGVDSFHALLRQDPMPTTLINVEGFDIRLDQTERLDAAREQYRQVADALEKRMLVVRTNLREHRLFKKTNWLWTSAGALGGVAQLLGNTCLKYLISATYESRGYPFDRFSQIGNCWSSERVSVDDVDSEFSRLDKVSAIMEYPIVRKSLRVCWSAVGIEPNCGDCEKCVRTRLCIEAAGWMEECRGLFVSQKSLECLVCDFIKKNGSVHGNSFGLSSVCSDLLEKPGALTEEVRNALQGERQKLTGSIMATRPKPVWVVGEKEQEGLVPDALFEPILNASKGMRVYYHKVAGNVGDDLIHEGARQLFERHQIHLVLDIHQADQVVFCGGGNIGIWEGCEQERERIYEKVKNNSLSAVLHPQSVAAFDIKLPDFIRPQFVRESESQRLLPGSILAPDLALAVTPIPQGVYGESIFEEGVFVRRDMEGLFADFEANLGDPRSLVPRDLDEYFRLASHYDHLITDRLHFCVAGLLLGRRVTLLPNSYHKNLGMWKTWLRDLGCQWAEHPSYAVSKKTPLVSSANRTRSRLSKTSQAPVSKSGDRIAMVLCIHNEQEFIEAHLRYHRKLGVEHAYVFLDRCTDRTEEIVRSFDWVEVVYRDTPPPPFHFRYFQTSCMNDAYQWACAAGYDWLLHIDPDEFVLAVNGKVDMEDVESGEMTALWRNASLKAMVAEIPESILQVVFETREALPTCVDGDFQENDIFISPGTPYPVEVLDPSSGKMRKPDKWLGHDLGKAMVRTNASLEAYNGHVWTTEQGIVEGKSPLKLPIPTVRGGWHAHFHSLRASSWWKKYKALAGQNKVWPEGGRMEFPRAEWSDAALKMESENDVREFLIRGVVVKSEQLEKLFMQEGCQRDSALRKMLADLAENKNRIENNKGE